MDWTKSSYFKPEEFDSPDAIGSGQLMSEDLVVKLNDARFFAGIPFKINSGFRTKDHNESVGGRPKSAHLTGEAVDISARNPRTRLQVLAALIKAGFRRFEVTPWHIHVDVARDDAHPQNLLFVLDKSGKLV